MRMAYVHGVAGVTALGLLGALLDAGHVDCLVVSYQPCSTS